MGLNTIRQHPAFPWICALFTAALYFLLASVILGGSPRTLVIETLSMATGTLIAAKFAQRKVRREG